MIQTNIHQVVSIGILTRNGKSGINKIGRYLASQPQYQLHDVSNADDAWTLLNRQDTDIFLAEMHTESSHLFEKVCSSLDDAVRPLLVMLADGKSGGLNDTFADMVVPPIDHYVDYAVSTLLKERTLRGELERENHTLQQENLALQTLLDEFENDTDHFELLKNAVIHNVSHELKTPLLHVKSAVKLLTEDVGRSTLTDYALGATARLEGVIKNITLLAEGLDINLGPIIVRESMDYALRNLRRSWEHKDAIDRIAVDLPAQLPPALGDSQGIGIVLQLLLDNALKFSEDRVQVSALIDQDVIHVTVRDDGIGIPHDKFDDIFEPFVQVDSSATRRYGGVGVGLAIVRLILEQHGSTIAVESKEGHGSQFSFALPIVKI